VISRRITTDLLSETPQNISLDFTPDPRHTTDPESFPSMAGATIHGYRRTLAAWHPTCMNADCDTAYCRRYRISFFIDRCPQGGTR